MVSLKAPVGTLQRITKGAKTANKPDDVLLVCRMLNANGLKIPNGTKWSSKLVDAIAFFQTKKLKYKKPDGVVDPGGKTFNALLPKYQAYETELLNRQYYTIVVDGKKTLITKDMKKKLRNLVFLRHQLNADKLAQNFGSYRDLYSTYVNARNYDSGIIKATSSFVTDTFNFEELPKASLIARAASDIVSYKSSISSQDAIKIHKAQMAAATSLNAFMRAMQIYSFRQKNAVVLTDFSYTVSKSIAGIVVVICAAPLIGAAAGISAASAGLAAAATAAGFESVVDEIVVFGDDPNRTLFDRAKSVGSDIVIGYFTEKMSKGLEASKAIGAIGRFAGKSANVIKRPASRVVVRKLIQEVTEAALVKGGGTLSSEAMKLVKQQWVTGKDVKTQDIYAAFQTAAISFLSAGLLKQLDKFDTEADKMVTALLEKKILPSLIADIVKDPDLGAKITQNLVKQFSRQTIQEVSNWAFNETISSLKGDESANEMLAIMQKKLVESRPIRNRLRDILAAQIDKEIEFQANTLRNISL